MMNKRIEKLDPTDKQILYSILNSSNDLPGAFARNLLIVSDNIQYDEPIILPDTGLKSDAVHSKDNITSTNNVSSFRIFPNPAEYFVILEYEDLKGNSVAEVIGTDGRSIESHYLDVTKKYISIDVKRYTPGLYMCRIVENGLIIETLKFIIL